MTPDPTPAERGLPEPAAVLERTWRATWFVGEDKLDHGIEKQAVYTADQMREMYRRGLAARPLPSDWVADSLTLSVKEREALEYAQWLLEDGASSDCKEVIQTISELLERTTAAPAAPAEGGDGRPLSERLYRGPAHPEAHRERFMEGSTATEPLAQHSPCKPAAWVQTASLSRLRDGWSATCYGDAWAERNDKTEFTPLYASPQPAAEAETFLPAGWYSFVHDCAQKRGMEVNGNRLSMKAEELLASLSAAPNPPQPSASVGEREPTAADVIESLKKLANMRPKPDDPPQVERMFDAACVFFVLAYAEYIESALTSAAAGGG